MYIKLFDIQGNECDSLEIQDSLLLSKYNYHVVNFVVRYTQFQRKGRKGYVKNRSEIRCSTKKLYAQKKRGAARHSTQSVNIFRGGGKAHGPRGVNHNVHVNKKVMKIALKNVLKDFCMQGPSTRLAKNFISSLGIKKPLFLSSPSDEDKNFLLSIRNIPNADYIPFFALNTYDILVHDSVVLHSNVFDTFKEKLYA